MILIFELMATIILIESITGIISKSELFEPLRKLLFNHKGNQLFKFAHSMIDCPYCLSVWVSFLCAGFFYLYINNWLPIILMWFCIAIVFHRLSNIIHFIIDRIDCNHTNLDKGN